MPYVASIGTFLPCRAISRHRVAGDDVAQVHDYFTGAALIGYEDLGPSAVSVVTILEGPVARGR